MLKFWFDVSMLGFEAQQVVWQRTMKIALGGRAGEREAVRMVSEKLTAAREASFDLAMGKGPNSLVSGYRKKVRANRRRLSR